MQQLTRLQARYEAYIRQCRQVAIDAPYGAGLLSSGKDPRNHPCHDAFYEEVGQMIADFSRQDADPEPVIRYMLEIPYFYANEDACWYLFGVQNHVMPLIPLLSRDARRAIGDWFSRLVPRRQRLPVQEEILSLLKQ